MSGIRLHENTFIHVEYPHGTEMRVAIDDAEKLSREKKLPVRFHSNGLPITVSAGDVDHD